MDDEISIWFGDCRAKSCRRSVPVLKSNLYSFWSCAINWAVVVTMTFQMFYTSQTWLKKNSIKNIQRIPINECVRFWTAQHVSSNLTWQFYRYRWIPPKINRWFQISFVVVIRHFANELPRRENNKIDLYGCTGRSRHMNVGAHSRRGSH